MYSKFNYFLSKSALSFQKLHMGKVGTLQDLFFYTNKLALVL